MACQICGNTKSSPCACKDHALTTPCSYTDCTDVNTKRGHPEHCAEIFCTDCLHRCRNDIQMSNSSGQTLVANQGDKLDVILQRLFIFTTNPSCYDSSVAHIWHDESATTTTTVKINFANVPSGVNNIDVEYAVINGAFVTDNTSPISTAANISYTVGTVTPLLPNTMYRFRIKSVGTNCYSVEYFVRTLSV